MVPHPVAIPVIPGLETTYFYYDLEMLVFNISMCVLRYSVAQSIAKYVSLYTTNIYYCCWVQPVFSCIIRCFIPCFLELNQVFIPAFLAAIFGHPGHICPGDKDENVI